MKKILLITVLVSFLLIGCSGNITTVKEYKGYLNENQIEKKIKEIEKIEEKFTNIDYKKDSIFIDESKKEILKIEGIINELKEKVDEIETTDDEIATIQGYLDKYLELKSDTVDINKKLLETYESIDSTSNKSKVKEYYKEIVKIINKGQTKFENSELYLKKWNDSF